MKSCSSCSPTLTIALNRVTGSEPSALLGQLLANGRIFLLNPNGILIGTGAKINTASFVAFTLNLKDADFLAGRYQFAQDPGKALRSILNRSTIQVNDHGVALLVAPGVRNEGLIVVNLGMAVLVSG